MRPVHPGNCSVSLGRSLDGSLAFFFFCCLHCLALSVSRSISVSPVLAFCWYLARSRSLWFSLSRSLDSLVCSLARSLDLSLLCSLALLIFRSLVFLVISLSRSLACSLSRSLSLSCFLAGSFPRPLSLSHVCCSLPDSCALSLSGLSARSLSRFRIDARTALR